MSRGARLGWLAGYVLVTFLSFPHPLGERVLDLGRVVSWIGPALLVVGLRGLSPRAAARSGFLASLAAHSAVLHWIYVVTVHYGHAPIAVGLVAPVLLASYVALFTGAFAALHAWFEARGVASAFSAALSWAALDHLRSFAASGFPWATLGYAQHANPALMGLASFTGVYGLSFVTVLGGVAGLEAIASWRRRRRFEPRTAAALAGVVAAHGLGFAAPDPGEGDGLRTVRVAVLQGNIDQGVKWSRAWVERTLSLYEHLSRRAAAEGARLVVWPETAVPGALEADGALRDRLESLARETGAEFVVGGVGVAFDGGTRPAHYFDSAFVLEDTGVFLDRYDKTHLVPFGEYVPFQDLLGYFVKAVARGMAATGVTPGPAPRAVPLAGAAAREGPLSIGIPICYELLFPDLVRRFAADGAQLLLGITNDAWYGRTGAPYQFLVITAMRSAETRLWAARAANTGVSAFIDARGRVRSATPIFETAYLVHDVPLHPDPQRSSFYVRFGDVFAAGCWLGSAALAGLAYSRRRARGSPAAP